MLHDISLRISYEYQSPAAGGRQIVRLMPADIAGEQRLVSGNLSITPPPHERRERRDFFGNWVFDLGFRNSYKRMDYVLNARVEKLPAAARPDTFAPMSQLADEVRRERSVLASSPVHFIGPSARVPVVPEIVAFARSIIGPQMSALAVVQAIGEALNSTMTFDAKATEVDTPMQEAFAQRRGVCQDYSHIMIGCLRAVGVPAGYVGGFLRTLPPPGKARLEGADAMHAWIRAWCGRDTGWVEYDPTNRMFADTDHMLIARGRDYSDVAPIRGVVRTSGGQETKQAVDVIPHEPN